MPWMPARVPLSLTLSGLVLTALAGCGGAAPNAAPAEGSSPAPGEAAGAEPIEEVDQPVAADIRTFDLGNTAWLYSPGGTELPVTVQLAAGVYTGDAGTYELGDAQYSDVDGDGDEDAVVSISHADGNGSERLWYLWLADGPEVAQLQYPIAQTSRCGTAVDAVVAGDGSVSVTQRLRIPGLDDTVACSEPGTGLQVRTITVYAEGELRWPVQTSPIPAWGGVCPGSPWPDSEPGLVDLYVVPSTDAAAAARAGAEGSVFALYPAPLMRRDGWAFVGFTQAAQDVGPVKLQCAWGAAVAG